MNTKFKSSLRAACQSFGVVCTVAVFLQFGVLAGYAQTGQYLFTGSETTSTLNPGLYYITAYGAQGGKIIWDFDTARSFDAVNGVPAKGGSLDVGGPVLAGGMMFVVSGYPGFGAMPGNALLAFAPE